MAHGCSNYTSIHDIEAANVDSVLTPLSLPTNRPPRFGSLLATNDVAESFVLESTAAAAVVHSSVSAQVQVAVLRGAVKTHALAHAT